MGHENILREADRLVSGARNGDYGHPYADFSRTAKLWSAVLGTTVGPADVALCMMCVKISREVHRPNRDNTVDIAGYARCLQMVREAEDGRVPPPCSHGGGTPHDDEDGTHT